MSVLILCHGNICRSPAAKAIMAQAGFEDTISAGFKDKEGLKSPKKVRDYLNDNYGISLLDHRSQLVTEEMLRTAELILYMDGGQAVRIEAVWRRHGLDEVRGPWGNFCEPLARYLNTPGEKIGDPMFQKAGSDEFIAIMEQLVEASRNFVQQRSESPIVADVV